MGEQWLELELNTKRPSKKHVNAASFDFSKFFAYKSKNNFTKFTSSHEIKWYYSQIITKINPHIISMCYLLPKINLTLFLTQ